MGHWLIFALLAASLGWAQQTAAPTIEQILANNVRAIGGKEAVQTKISRVMRGIITAPALGSGQGTFELYAKATNKQLTVIARGHCCRAGSGVAGLAA